MLKHPRHLAYVPADELWLTLLAAGCRARPIHFPCLDVCTYERADVHYLQRSA